MSKELDSLVESIIENMRYDPDNWTSLKEDNGFYEVCGWVRTLDWKFTVLTFSYKITNPYKYNPSTGLKSELKKYSDIILNRDKKQLSKLNSKFLANIESYKKDLDTYTDTQKAEILRVNRTNKMGRLIGKT